MRTLTVTVVVTTHNAARTLAACLASVRMQTYPRIEVVVADNDSTDATRAIAGTFADHVVRSGPGLGAQRNDGWRHGTGEIVVFVDADMVLEPTVVADAVAGMSAGPLLGALVIPELAFGEGFFARCRILEKRLALDDPDTGAARVYRRVVLEELGGYDEASGRADLELSGRVRAAGHGVARIAARTWRDEGKLRLRTAFANTRRSVKQAPERGVASRRLARLRMLRKLPVAKSPVRCAGLVVLKSVELAGRAVPARRGRHAG